MFFEEFSSSVPSPTIFIHGNLGSNHWWYPAISQMRELGRGRYHYTSYLVEFRGCGRTEYSLRPEEIYPIEAVADDIALFIEEKIKTPVNLVGHSTGGFISMLLASKNPDLVQKLVLVDSVGSRGLSFGDEIYQIYDDMKSDASLVEKVIRKAVLRKNNIDPALWKEICRMVQISVGRLGAAIPISLRGVDFTQQFSQIIAETLIIHGKKDGIIDIASSENLRNILRRSVLRILENVGHSPNIEDPALFAYIIGEHLQK